MKRITDPDFKYVPAVETDIRKTFARVRREQAAAAAQREQEHSKVTILNKRAK